MPGLEAAWQDVDISFDRFCLVAGIGHVTPVRGVVRPACRVDGLGPVQAGLAGDPD